MSGVCVSGVCVCVPVCMCVSVFMRVSMRVCVCVCVRVHVYVQVCVCMYASVCVYVCDCMHALLSMCARGWAPARLSAYVCARARTHVVCLRVCLCLGMGLCVRASVLQTRSDCTRPLVITCSMSLRNNETIMTHVIMFTGVHM